MHPTRKQPNLTCRRVPAAGGAARHRSARNAVALRHTQPAPAFVYNDEAHVVRGAKSHRRVADARQEIAGDS
jgi:hypothetical protein